MGLDSPLFHSVKEDFSVIIMEFLNSNSSFTLWMYLFSLCLDEHILMWNFDCTAVTHTSVTMVTHLLSSVTLIKTTVRPRRTYLNGHQTFTSNVVAQPFSRKCKNRLRLKWWVWWWWSSELSNSYTFVCAAGINRSESIISVKLTSVTPSWFLS